MMNDDTWNADVGESLDGHLERLITGYLERINSGESLDPAEVLAENPHWGPEILEGLQHFLDLSGNGESDEPLGTLGDYTLRRQIGRGGMGVVYEAWQGSMDRVVALKVLPAGIAADERAVGRFIREAQAAGRLDHPNVVHVHGMGVEENTPYYSMEYVEGETLAQIVARTKEVEPDTETVFGHKDGAGYFENLSRAFADVADGLQHAHSKGVVHRDIKPSNLILDGDGKLRILDFGLARLEGQESLTLSGDLMGTVLYMSPEQAMAKRIPLDHRTDIYSLGVTMYEMLTWRVPFQGKTHQDTLSQIMLHEPRPPRQLNPRIPKDLETIVLKCLRKEARTRYGTAEALAQDLRRFVRGDPIEARPQSRWEKLVRKVQRNRGRIAATVCTLVAAFLVGGGAYLYVESENRARIGEAEQAVTSFIEEARRLQGVAVESQTKEGLSRWRDALAEAEKAAERARDDVDPGLRSQATDLLAQLRREVKNRDMLARLEVLPFPEFGLNKFEYLDPTLYADAFREYGIDVEALAPEIAAQRIQETGIADELALAIDIWAKLLRRPSTLRLTHRLFDVAMRVDPNIWRNHVRQSIVADDVEQAKELAASADVRIASDRRLGLLAAHLYARDAHDEAESLLRRAYEFHENSYWINYWHGLVLAKKGKVEESLRYFTAAIAIRPERARPRVEAAKVLTGRGELQAAAHQHRKAMTLEPGARYVYDAMPTLIGKLHTEGQDGLLDDLVRALDELLRSDRECHPGARRALITGWVLRPESLESARALAVATRAVERSLRRDAKALTQLARVQYTTGKPGVAVRTLEEASHVGAMISRETLLLLDEYREGLRTSQMSYAALDAVLDAGEALMPHGAVWRFFRGVREPSPGLEWTRHDFDDTSWKQGPAGFGYGDADDATPLEAMMGSYTTVYIRRRFTLADPGAYTRFWLSVSVDDGCVAYLNGEEIGRLNVGDRDRRLSFDAVAVAEAAEPLSPVVFEIDGSLLKNGENILAVQGFNSRKESSDFSLIPILRADAYPMAIDGQFDDLRAADANGSDASAGLTYLEGRLLERAGQHEPAAAMFREVIAHARGFPEPFLRLAESLRAAGDAEAAEKTLRELLAEGTFSHIHGLWNLWLAVSLVDLERKPGEVLRDFPAASTPISGAAEIMSMDYAGSLRWLLERLERNEAIRINCGARTDYEGVDGKLWGRDQFFVRGVGVWSEIYGDRIKGTDDDALFAEWRYFHPTPGTDGAYRVPLPPGRYRVTLHFSEAYSAVKSRPDTRHGHYLLEGKMVLRDYSAADHVSFAHVDVHSFEVTVEDGLLEIGIIDRPTPLFPFLSAFEIEKLD